MYVSKLGTRTVNDLCFMGRLLLILVILILIFDTWVFKDRKNAQANFDGHLLD